MQHISVKILPTASLYVRLGKIMDLIVSVVSATYLYVNVCNLYQAYVSFIRTQRCI